MNEENMLKELTANISSNVPEIITACYTYIAAKAKLETVQELETECKKAVLSAHTFRIDEQFKSHRGVDTEVITKPSQDYLMPEADFAKYLEYLYPLYLEKGIADPRGAGYCPDAVPREELKNAENILIDTFLKIVPAELRPDFEKMRTHWKYRQKLIDIALDMLKLETVKEA